ncbi:hypothetical protein PRIPAC_88346 [Pristionchus pacificus]|uniref:Uncharacterized protein n=1 Tax=Pristionchus pacificus TaxID=54126 RepID=A0A2A6CV31_PRIPA|nr:hypothetical protein PRIPAC_88346 [Pristionchus pacificus]|eukprot:PDM82094.1 hypothetical protein PRIPAC_36487 [Pristionchus pacificus]
MMKHTANLLTLALFVIVHVNDGAVYTTSNTRCKTDKSAVLDTSLARIGDVVQISSFRGGGAAEESDEPRVNSSVIYYSLFDREGFSSIFAPTIENETVFEQNFNTRNFSLSTRQFMKIPLNVVDASRPMTINTGSTSLYYFWGPSFLPIHTPDDCAHYTTMNGRREVTFCLISEMERCAANISDLPHFAPLAFFTEAGERLAQFSWLCPKGQVCCAYECCDLANWIPGLIIMGSFAAAALLCICVICVKKAVDKHKEWKGARRNSSTPMRFQRVSSDPRISEHKFEHRSSTDQAVAGAPLQKS